jgi:4-hydroxy-tetrahydrodipicolinate reductase
MKIALLGYGKMGKEIEQVALQRGHTIELKVNSVRPISKALDQLNTCDVAIDFSLPSTVYAHILACFDQHVPVVVGTTAWQDKQEEIIKTCTEKGQALLYASNFSIGVNLFFELNRKLALLMQHHTNYTVAMEEIHHTQKLDAPSGTAITLANTLLATLPGKHKWVNHVAVDPVELGIVSVRKDDVPGTHTVNYASEVDSIEIKHTAHNRKGFALGAVIAAEFIHGKKGVFGMQDVLQLNNKL